MHMFLLKLRVTQNIQKGKNKQLRELGQRGNQR